MKNLIIFLVLTFLFIGCTYTSTKYTKYSDGKCSKTIYTNKGIINKTSTFITINIDCKEMDNN